MSKNKGLFDLGTYQKSVQLKRWTTGLNLLTGSDVEDALKVNGGLIKDTIEMYNDRMQLVDCICECFEIGVELDSYTGKE